MFTGLPFDWYSLHIITTFALLIKLEGDNNDVSKYIFIESFWLRDDELFDTRTGFPKKMPDFSPEELISMTYLLPPEPEGQCFRAKTIKAILDTNTNSSCNIPIN